jgi:hypothetical protein
MHAMSRTISHAIPGINMVDDEDDDPDLFSFKPKPPKETGGVRSSDPITSHEAAESVPVNKLELLFLQALTPYPTTLTTTEIANYHGMDRDSFSPRPPKLLAKKLIEPAGYRLCANSAGKMRKMIAFRLRRP